MSTIFNSLSKEFKFPIGPLKEDELLILRISLEKNLSPENVQVVFLEYFTNTPVQNFTMYFENTDEEHIYYKAEISKLKLNIYCYFFTFLCNGKTKFLKMCNDSWNAFITDNNTCNNWQLTVYEPIQTHPNMKKGIMYQIFPDRFNKSHKNKNLPPGRTYRNWGELPFYSDDKICTDFFGGNLQGIIEKIDYLKSLNVSVIYLNPIWEANQNHRYNTASYENIDPVLGNIEDLKELIEIAHSNDIIIILDTVLNHTGSHSVYFNKDNNYPSIGAYNSTNSLFYNWYYFHNNNPDDYESWWGFETLPKLNQNNPDFINYFFSKDGIVDKWYNLGIDGLRLDVADELENSTLIRVNETSKRNRDAIVIIGEVWDNASNKCNYGHRMNYFLGNELTSVMNYPVKDAVLSYIRYGDNNMWSKNLEKTLISIFIEDYPREIAYSLMNFLSSHDTVRAITKLSGKEVNDHDRNWQNENDALSREEYKLGKSRLMISYLFIFFLPGIPSIFYGDEIGLSGQKDPFCRKCFTWDRIDKKLLIFFRALTIVRNQYSEFLSKADFNICKINNEICIYERSFKEKSLIVFINRTNIQIDLKNNFINLDFITKDSKKLTNFSIEINILFSIGKNSDVKVLDPYGAILVEVTKKSK